MRHAVTLSLGRDSACPSKFHVIGALRGPKPVCFCQRLRQSSNSEINYRALGVNPFENPSRVIKNENTFKSADELKLKSRLIIAFSSE